MRTRSSSANDVRSKSWLEDFTDGLSICLSVCDAITQHLQLFVAPILIKLFVPIGTRAKFADSFFGSFKPVWDLKKSIIYSARPRINKQGTPLYYLILHGAKYCHVPSFSEPFNWLIGKHFSTGPILSWHCLKNSTVLVYTQDTVVRIKLPNILEATETGEGIKGMVQNTAIGIVASAHFLLTVSFSWNCLFQETAQRLILSQEMLPCTITNSKIDETNANKNTSAHHVQVKIQSTASLDNPINLSATVFWRDPDLNLIGTIVWIRLPSPHLPSLRLIRRTQPNQICPWLY